MISDLFSNLLRFGQRKQVTYFLRDGFLIFCQKFYKPITFVTIRDLSFPRCLIPLSAKYPTIPANNESGGRACTDS